MFKEMNNLKQEMYLELFKVGELELVDHYLTTIYTFL